MDDEYDYEPSLFLRCHSKTNERKTDIQTQVWHTEFQPNNSSTIIATAGGFSIVFTDVEEQKILKKYKSKNLLEVFYCLTWIEVPCDEFDSVTLLVAGSSIGKLHIIHYERDEAIAEIELIEKKSKKESKSKKDIVAINCVATYLDESNHQSLLCGLSNGEIKVLDFNCTSLTNKSLKCNYNILGSLHVDSDVLQMAFCPTTKTILAACNEGLVGCHVPSKEHFKNNNYQVTKFVLTEKFRKKDQGLTDTVQIIDKGLIAVKYALHGAIYVFDLKYLFDKQKKLKAITEYTPKYILEWSKTDNYYLNMGVNKAANILACGDDEGTIWLYNIGSLKNGGFTTPEVRQPTAKIDWPIVDDMYASKKLKLGTYDVVLNKVAVHSSGKFIVAVTNNNTVCLYKKVEQNDEST